MTVKSFTFNPFATNLFVFHSEGEAVVVDAACHTEREMRAVVDYVAAQRLEVKHLLLTHGHIDHIFGCTALAAHFGMGWQMHRDDLPMIDRAMDQAAMFGVELEQPPRPASFLEEGDEIRFGDAVWRVRHTPGHSPGSVSFVDDANELVVAGDVLFQGSVGRTDLPGGSMPVLMRSLFGVLLELPDGTRVYCGHGPATTIGQERRSNPFLTDAGFPA